MNTDKIPRPPIVLLSESGAEQSATRDSDPPACSNCYFSRSIFGAGEVLNCCRHAPSADPDPMRLAKFPRVTPTGWCGEYVRAEEEL
jgi:hypothetical protein